MDDQQLAELRAELEAELAQLERSMRTTEEGLKPVKLDPPRSCARRTECGGTCG